MPLWSRWKNSRCVHGCDCFILFGTFSPENKRDNPNKICLSSPECYKDSIKSNVKVQIQKGNARGNEKVKKNLPLKKVIKIFHFPMLSLISHHLGSIDSAHKWASAYTVPHTAGCNFLVWKEQLELRALLCLSASPAVQVTYTLSLSLPPGASWQLCRGHSGINPAQDRNYLGLIIKNSGYTCIYKNLLQCSLQSLGNEMKSGMQNSRWWTKQV